ncbi:(2Fe-2S)-binding protein [bacterium]|nr:(2Fe-2S)-binding protein [bacterium]
MITVKFEVNNIEREIEVRDNETLLETLRERLKLIGTKEGCGKGECGACTVMIDGKPVASCLVLTGQVEGKSIVTIEGIGDVENPHVIQQSYIDEGAIQCGFCIPGMVVSSYALLKEKPEPSEEEIKDALSGNLCRCTGYRKIIAAVKTAGKKIKETGVEL